MMSLAIIPATNPMMIVQIMLTMGSPLFTGPTANAQDRLRLQRNVPGAQAENSQEVASWVQVDHRMLLHNNPVKPGSA